MSEHKRVLVVDDSKSARLVLRRMLERHDLVVDAVESANEALDFLSYNRPDAIFMDHMMPGMDGFQAVKAIKANPRTATIPVMMYTSKGGDLYIGQARALGAVGVLPKTVAPAELFESLQKIGLIGDRRSDEQDLDTEDASERAIDIQQHGAAPVTPFTEPGMHTPADKLTPEQLDQQLRHLLEEQRVEIRKDVLLSMETVARQTNGKLHKELDEKIDQLDDVRRKPATPLLFPAVVFASLLAVSLLLNLLMYFDSQTTTQVATRAGSDVLAGQAQAQQASAITELEALQAETVAALRNSLNTVAWAMNQSLTYPYDEIALDNLRVDKVEALLGKLLESDFRGTLVVETHAGEFCLSGDQETGFNLPAPDLPVDQCEFIGNPVQAADTPSAHQSLRFANFVTSTPLLSDDRIKLEIVTLPRSEALAPYPEKSAETKAHAWNRAARQNNRVSVRLEAK